MSFKIMVEGDYALFTRPEMKVERVSYEVPTVSALEGLLKAIYWKPAIRYVIDKIIVFNPVRFINIRRNECKNKVSLRNMQSKMNGGDASPVIYMEEDRTQRTSMLLKKVRYGIEFHFEMTGIRSERADDTEEKHCSIIAQRLEKGQWFRNPCLGCSEFPARVEVVKDFDLSQVTGEHRGDIDLGRMLYRTKFESDNPVNGDWDNPRFLCKASAEYYHPHMIDGVIDVSKYVKGGR